MKRIIASLIIFIVIVLVSSLHVYKVITLTSEINKSAEKVYTLYQTETWTEIEEELNKMSDLWNNNKLWAYLTLSTVQVDEIEISLEQCISYSQIEAKPDFIGEFRMFCILIDHLPKQETFSFEELL